MAVALLEQQNIGSAITSALEALRLHKEQTATDLPCSADETDSIATLHRTITIDQCMLLSNYGNSRLIQSDSNNNTFFYGQGIQIPDDSSMTNSAVISAVVLFNVAVAHQLLANHPRDQAPSSLNRLLVKARRLYELAYELYHQAAEGGDVLFPFVVTNNLAVIEHRLGNTVTSILYFEILGRFRREVLDGEEQQPR